MKLDHQQMVFCPLEICNINAIKSDILCALGKILKPFKSMKPARECLLWDYIGHSYDVT